MQKINRNYRKRNHKKAFAERQLNKIERSNKVRSMRF